MPMITDWLMVGITFVYVVATIAIWLVNRKSAHATEEQLAESKRQFEETKRVEHMPYLEITLNKHIKDFTDADLSLAVSSHGEEERTVVDLQIILKNIGLGAAKDFRYLWTNMDGSYLRNDLPFLACLPAEEQSILIDFYFEHPADMSSYDATVQIQFQFKDLLENQYQQELTLTYLVSGPDKIKLIKHTVGTPILVPMPK